MPLYEFGCGGHSQGRRRCGQATGGYDRILLLNRRTANSRNKAPCPRVAQWLHPGLAGGEPVSTRLSVNLSRTDPQIGDRRRRPATAQSRVKAEPRRVSSDEILTTSDRPGPMRASEPLL